MAIHVVLESSAKHTFASALDWPGWVRRGRSEDHALETLVAYLPRYRPVAARAGRTVPDVDAWEVIQRLPGGGGTDFGVPGAIADVERTVPEDPARLSALVRAAFTTFDAVAATAPPTLRKGPRGGGRDRDDIIDHVHGAEIAYARRLGLDAPARDAKRASPHPPEVLREMILDVLAEGAPPESPKHWPVPFAARYIAWHALDHAWEIEDKSS